MGNQCDKQYKTNGELIAHKERVHDKKTLHKCDFCPEQFYKMCGKKDHMNSVHSDERPFACEHCGETFKLRKALIAHQQKHNAEKQFECTKCHKRFQLRDTRNKHQRIC